MEGKKWIITLLSLAFLGACPPKRCPQAPPAAPPSVDQECAKLTPTEQKFAEQLSAVHRHIFCTQFTVMQRAEAMALYDPGKVSPDEAIEAVLKQARGQPPMPPPSQAKKPSLKIIK